MSHPQISDFFLISDEAPLLDFQFSFFPTFISVSDYSESSNLIFIEVSCRFRQNNLTDRVNMPRVLGLYCPTCRGTPVEHFWGVDSDGIVNAACLCAERSTLLYAPACQEEVRPSQEQQPSSQRVEVPDSTGQLTHRAGLLQNANKQQRLQIGPKRRTTCRQTQHTPRGPTKSLHRVGQSVTQAS